MTFQDRFKSKVSSMGKHGELLVKLERAVTKPVKTQIHSPAMKSPEFYLNYSTETVQSLSNHYHSLSVPARKKENNNGLNSFLKPSNSNASKPKTVNFTPYSLKDYYLIKPEKYYVLGGSGPRNIGTDEWNYKKKIIDKRKKYGNDANMANTKKVYKSMEFYSNRYDELMVNLKNNRKQGIEKDY